MTRIGRRGVNEAGRQFEEDHKPQQRENYLALGEVRKTHSWGAGGGRGRAKERVAVQGGVESRNMPV